MSDMRKMMQRGNCLQSLELQHSSYLCLIRLICLLRHRNNKRCIRHEHVASAPCNCSTPSESLVCIGTVCHVLVQQVAVRVQPVVALQGL